MYRFDKTAILHKAVLSSDDEQARAGVAGVTFSCFEQTLKTKGQSMILDGAIGNMAALVLQTDNSIALTIESDDFVVFEGHRYTVVSVGQIRSSLYRGAREYLISLH